ncbi:hypothetical protein STIAU_3703 [Stigmatella aurantiaca DW4/3-1]|uniref:Uncharacterized protein n=1 Tax=Stigmatella aurantiaca (strain DW4/3-1) TaxID=378806 RepID=Q09CD5_STIAD|nr:hypothetical protein STIAU_3703 [Stigmatella aurantiaca DW4/3-1]
MAGREGLGVRNGHLHPGQPGFHLRSHAGLGIHDEQPSVRLHQPLHGGQPQAMARTAPGLGCPEERLEERGPRRRAHPHAVVHHLQHRLVPRRKDPDGDARRGLARRVLHRVGHQVARHHLEQLVGAVHRHARHQLPLQRHPQRGGGLRQLQQHRAHRRVQLRRRMLPTAPGPAEAQQRLDELAHAPRARLTLRQHLQRPRVHHPPRAADERQVSLERCQRPHQVVRHPVGEGIQLLVRAPQVLQLPLDRRLLPPQHRGDVPAHQQGDEHRHQRRHRTKHRVAHAQRGGVGGQIPRVLRVLLGQLRGQLVHLQHQRANPVRQVDPGALRLAAMGKDRGGTHLIRQRLASRVEALPRHLLARRHVLRVRIGGAADAPQDVLHHRVGRLALPVIHGPHVGFDGALQGERIHPDPPDEARPIQGLLHEVVHLLARAHLGPQGKGRHGGQERHREEKPGPVASQGNANAHSALRGATPASPRRWGPPGPEAVAGCSAAPGRGPTRTTRRTAPRASRTAPRASPTARASGPGDG